MVDGKDASRGAASTSAEAAEHDSGEELEATESKLADEKQALHAQVIYELIRREGERELGRPTSALFWSGLAAGMSMGFSLVAEGLLHARLPDAPWRPLVSNLGYAVGFILVILGSQQLFTENTLRAVIPLLHNRTARMARNVARLWAAVLIANLLGAFFFAAIVTLEGLFGPEVHAAFETIGREQMAGGFTTLFLRGIFAGYIIAMMLWLLPEAQAAKVIVITILAYVIGIAEFSHIVAGSVDVLYLVAGGLVPMTVAVSHYMVPTLLGNTLGGVMLVAAVAHAQVVAGRD